MRLKLFIFALLLCTAASAVAAPAVRQPMAAWNVDFADAQCVASRSYGTAHEPLHFVLKAPPIGNVVQIAVMRKGGGSGAEQVDATINVDQQPALKTNMLAFGSKNSKLRIYLLNMRSADFESVRRQGASPSAPQD
jgi:hypothetical protein